MTSIRFTLYAAITCPGLSAVTLVTGCRDELIIYVRLCVRINDIPGVQITIVKHCHEVRYFIV